jgi:DNA-binding PadR family transcriptional regulator
MAMQRIENSFTRGLEIVGLITPARLVPRVTEAFISLLEEGVDAVTAPQLRKKIDELHPATGWFPMSKGSLPDALKLMEQNGEITSELIPHSDKTGRVQDVSIYRMIEKHQQP